MILVDSSLRIVAVHRPHAASPLLDNSGALSESARAVVEPLVRALADGKSPASEPTCVDGAAIRVILLEASNEAIFAISIESDRRAHAHELIAQEYDLTNREMEVTKLLVAGMRTTEIAQELGIATSTTLSYIKGIMLKMGLRSRVQIVAAMARRR